MLRTLVQRCVVSVPRSHTCTTSRHLLQRVASSAPLPTRSSSSTTSTSTTSGRIDDAAVAVNRLDALREQASSSKQALASIYRLPSSFRPTHSITRYVREFEHAVAPGQRLLESPVTLAGRITKRRDASKKLIFYDLESGGTKVQIMADRATASDPHEFDLLHQQLQRGDIVGTPSTIALDSNRIESNRAQSCSLRMCRSHWCTSQDQAWRVEYRAELDVAALAVYAADPALPWPARCGTVPSRTDSPTPAAAS